MVIEVGWVGVTGSGFNDRGWGWGLYNSPVSRGHVSHCTVNNDLSTRESVQGKLRKDLVYFHSASEC